MENIENLLEVKQLCLKVVESGNKDDILNLANSIRQQKSLRISQSLQRDLLATFYLVLRNESQNKSKLAADDKLIVIEILGTIFSRSKLNSRVVFFNLFGFLLQEIYDQETHKIKNISEEHKLAILTSVKCLLNCTSHNLTEELYTKENGVRICKMIYIAVEIAAHEKFRTLRIEAIECLMALFKVHSDDDYADVLFRKLVAENFSFFLPGVALCLSDVALKDEKVGHKLIQISLKAAGRIISLLMQDYSVNDFASSSLEEAKEVVIQYLNQNKTPKIDESDGNENKVEEYMKSTRNPDWFKKSDRYLSKVLSRFKKLTQHPIVTVRKELCEVCIIFIEKCSRNMLKSHRYLVEILIILSEDENPEISNSSKNRLKQLTSISSGKNILLMNELIDGFQSTVSEIPSIFNGIDNRDKISVLKLTAAYVNLIGQNLQLNDCYKEFLRIILHLCEFEIVTATFNQNVIIDLDGGESLNSSLWNNLKFLNEESLRQHFNNLCCCLVKNNLFESVSDFLNSVYEDEKREATYLLNQLILGLKNSAVQNKQNLIQPIFQLYTDPGNWNLPLRVKSEDFEGYLTLQSVRMNIQQVSLSVYGIGVMAEVLGKEFSPFLLKSLYLILARAGSDESMIQSAGGKALRNIADALGFPNVTSLINQNMDYIAFYVERGLKNNDSNGNSFDVLEVVMNYGDKTTLGHLVYIIEEVLVQCCDKFKQERVDSYLRIFKVFMKCVMRWFEITIPPSILKSKSQKEEELLKSFKVNGLDNIEEIKDFSDDIMGKSAEELYKEDIERKNNEMNGEILESNGEEYKKPEPPYHIKLTIEILKRSLNFLPSKENERKLLVLEILTDGVEILKDYDDELLPIVHLIWSPLVARFKDVNAPVIINYCFHLLVVLARVSKDFIRNRTAKDVLPSILEILLKSSKESYLKDKGSAYRYTQMYKLQLKILEKLGYLVADLDLSEKDIEKTMEVVLTYLDNKQPIPLQTEAVNFFKLIIEYEPKFRNKINEWLNNDSLPDKNNLNNILKSF